MKLKGRTSILLAAGVTAALLLSGPILDRVSAQDDADEERPFRSSFIETAEVSLILLDVVVTDKQGRPVPGLTKGDFTIRLNGRKWPIYSVDDLCGCAAESLVAEGTADPGRPPGGEDREQDRELTPQEAAVVETLSSGGATDPVSYVLYIDFSQLQGDGRDNALAEARRWILDVKRRDDRAILVAYATESGLRELTELTDERSVLLAALNDAFRDPDFEDPFANGFTFRIDDCQACCGRTADDPAFRGLSCRNRCPICVEHAQNEYFHGRRAIRAFQRFLVKLEGIHGRKIVIFFHQNNVIFPGTFYPVNELDVPDHIADLDVAGAEATTSRAVVYPAYAGNDPNMFSPLSGQAVNFGANLADFTGGEYNRTIATLPEMTSGAGRGCECVYRIGVEPPREDKTRVYRAVVEVGDRRLRGSYRVQHLTSIDRWWRDASQVMVARDDEEMPVAAALVPLAPAEGGWTVEIQVVVDLASLVLIPAAGEAHGQWEVGALLQKEGGKRWEMLGVSSVTLTEGETTPDLVVHERGMALLKPGTYTLGAFVHDKTGDVFGGARVEIDLPKPDNVVVAGPVLMRLGKIWVRTGLPLFDKKARTETPTRTRSVHSSPIPAGRSAFDRGERLEAWTWICPSGEPVNGKAVRYVSRAGEPLFGFDVVEKAADQDCFQIRDVIETEDLAPGDYAYHIRWNESTMAEPVTSETSFEIPAPVAPETATAVTDN